MATPIPANRARFTLDELLAATSGRAIGLDGAEVESISTDSRTVPAGGLFVALRGETHDGHRFVEPARARGAVAMVAAGAGVEGPRIEVADPLVALGALARAHVDRLARVQGPLPTLAIGGAAGKTTTKTLAAAGVAALFGETLVTAGNLNNRIGVPMTLLTLEPRHRAVVLECGTSEPGEIAALGAVARPDAALVLNVGIEHSEKLGSLEAIAEEEGALLDAARRAAITSSEEPLLVARLARCPAPAKLTFGSSSRADLRLAGREVDALGRSNLRFQLSAAFGSGRELRVTTALLGPHAATNAAAAAAGALALLGRDATAAELERLAAALGAVAAVPGRMRPLALGDLLVLDDAYNSNPRSVRAALEAARETAARRGGGLVVALGDMLELGELAPTEHDAMVAAADAAGARRLVLVGPQSAAAAARSALATPTALFASSEAAAAAIGDLVLPGEVVLVKGSRGIRTERLIAALARRAGVEVGLAL